VSYRIADCSETHTVAKNFILHCVVLSANPLKVIRNVTLSNFTILRRIEDLSFNIECELIKQTESSQGFAMQVDESTDVASPSVLLAFVVYIFNNQVEEEMLMCKPLPIHTTG
jgi:hypothetical protein